MTTVNHRGKPQRHNWCVDRIKKSLDSVLLMFRHLNHVVQRLLIAQSEALSDVQHVNLSTGDHNADQSVVSCAQTLQTDGQTKGLTKTLRIVLLLH